MRKDKEEEISMAKKICLYKRSSVNRRPTLVKCGSRRELNTYAMLKKGCKWRKNSNSLFGGYFYDEKGTTYEFDTKGGFHRE